jgi:Pentapeptide repeats (9 copies)
VPMPLLLVRHTYKQPANYEHRVVILSDVELPWSKRVQSADQSPKSAADGLSMMPIGAALATALFVSICTVTVFIVSALLLLGLPSLQQPGPLPLANLLDLIKLAFAAIAGIGATVALVVAYRRQRVAEANSRLEHGKEERERFRILNERFSTAAGQLGSDQPAIRLAGVYSMASLADDWPQQRQTCVDVLCGYLRMPYEPDPGADAPSVDRVAFARDREVRHAVIRVIGDHLRPGAGTVLWQDCRFDFRGAVFDGGNFSFMEIPKGCVLNFLETTFVAGRNEFQGCRFTGGLANFWHVNFAGGTIYFHGVAFAEDHVAFGDSTFSGGLVDFGSDDDIGGPGLTTFAMNVTFKGCLFNGAEVLFGGARFSDGTVDFTSARFSGGRVDFADVKLEGGHIDFREVTDWSVPPVNLPSLDSSVSLPRTTKVVDVERARLIKTEGDPRS